LLLFYSFRQPRTPNASMSTAEVLSFVQSQVKIGDDRATADYFTPQGQD